METIEKLPKFQKKQNPPVFLIATRDAMPAAAREFIFGGKFGAKGQAKM